MWPSVSGSICPSFPFPGEEVAPHPCSQLRTPSCIRICIVQPLPTAFRSSHPGSTLTCVRAFFCPSIYENTIRLDRVVHTACSGSICVRHRSAKSSAVSFKGSPLWLLTLHRKVAVPHAINMSSRPITIRKISYHIFFITRQYKQAELHYSVNLADSFEFFLNIILLYQHILFGSACDQA